MTKPSLLEAGHFYIPASNKLGLVIRIKGAHNLSPNTRKILQLLRLHRINNGTFLKLNNATIKMLLNVEPYVLYGYPSLKTVNGLIYKRGFGKLAGQRIALTDNSLVAKVLAKYNIICTEDLIHEIFTVG